MIRPLRRRHRLWITTLAVALPVGLTFALSARRPAPLQAALPAPLCACPPEEARELGHWPDLWRALAVDTRLLALAGGGERLELVLAGDDAPPDLLLYLDPGGGNGTGDRLPEGAVLLGPLPPGRRVAYDLPEPAAGAVHLVAYSLAHGTVAGGARLPSVAPGE